MMANMKQFILYSLLIICSALITACSPTLSHQDEEAATSATINWLDQKFGFIGNEEFISYNSRITERLSGAARLIKMNSAYKARAESFQWNAYLLNVPQVNAFSVGNGSIVITRGLLVLLEDEAQYASIIAHEMAHQILGHTEEAIIESKENDVTPTFYFSVDKELEADRLALIILSQARYEPKQALVAFNLTYRNQSKGIAEGPDEAKKSWLDARAVNIKYLVAKYQSEGPAKVESREFTKIRTLIAQEYGSN